MIQDSRKETETVMRRTKVRKEKDSGGLSLKAVYRTRKDREEENDWKITKRGLITSSASGCHMSDKDTTISFFFTRFFSLSLILVLSLSLSCNMLPFSLPCFIPHNMSHTLSVTVCFTVICESILFSTLCPLPIYSISGILQPTCL